MFRRRPDPLPRAEEPPVAPRAIMEPPEAAAQAVPVPDLAEELAQKRREAEELAGIKTNGATILDEIKKIRPHNFYRGDGALAADEIKALAGFARGDESVYNDLSREFDTIRSASDIGNPDKINLAKYKAACSILARVANRPIIPTAAAGLAAQNAAGRF